MAQLNAYVEEAGRSHGVTFAGRLGTYRYIDMDVAISEAMNLAERLKKAWRDGVHPPTFSADPLK